VLGLAGCSETGEQQRDEPAMFTSDRTASSLVSAFDASHEKITGDQIPASASTKLWLE